MSGIRFFTSHASIFRRVGRVLVLLTAYIGLNLLTGEALAVGMSMHDKALVLSRFGESLVLQEADTSSRSIRIIINDIKVIEEKYLEKLGEARSSYGLFAIGTAAHDTLNSESRASIGLEWRLFNDGYFEAIRRDRQKILQAQLEFYQMREDMLTRKLDEDLYRLSTIENQVNLVYCQEKAAALNDLLKMRVRQLENGYTTALDVRNLERQLRDVQHSGDFYRTIPRIGLDKELRDILNGLEDLILKPQKNLEDSAQAQSNQLKIQDTFIARSDFLPSWTDDIAVDLEAGYSREYSEKDRNVIGIRIELPLSMDSDRSSLVDTQKRIYRLQKEAVRHRLQQQMDKLYSFYHFQQQRLLAQQENLRFLLEMRESNNLKEQNSLQKFDDDPTRNLQLLEVNIIDSRYEALLTRLKLYEIVLKILAMTQEQEITSLFVLH